MTYTLKGLAEGVVGKSRIEADSVESVYHMYSELSIIKDKITVNGNTLEAFCACDG